MWLNLGCGYWWFNRGCRQLWVHGFVVGLILEWVMVGSWWLKFCGVFFLFEGGVGRYGRQRRERDGEEE